ncbi:MAG: hypothetical protein VB857_12345 [Pirellulaceae bacterium]
MRRAVAYSVFYGWLLMAGYGYAQVPTTETLIWQRVPATLSAAPRLASPVAAYPVSNQSAMVQPAITWRPVSQSVMVPMQLVSHGQVTGPAYQASSSSMMAWKPMPPGGTSAVQPAGHWQTVSQYGVPVATAAATQWRPVLQQASPTMQQAVYWQPISAANQVPRLGSPLTQSHGFSGNCVPCGGLSTIPADAYSRRNTSSYGYGSVARYRPIMSLGSVPQDYQVGQGLLGQPKVYVPGQPLRNFVRYLTP